MEHYAGQHFRDTTAAGWRLFQASQSNGPRGVTRGGKAQLRQGGRVTTRARPPQTGPGRVEGGGVGRRSSDMPRRAAHASGQEGRERGATHLTSRGRKEEEEAERPPSSSWYSKRSPNQSQGETQRDTDKRQEAEADGETPVVGGTSILTQCPEPETCLPI